MGQDSGNIKIVTESCLPLKHLRRPGHSSRVQGDGGVFLNTSSCAGYTVLRHIPKWRSLEQSTCIAGSSKGVRLLPGSLPF